MIKKLKKLCLIIKNNDFKYYYGKYKFFKKNKYRKLNDREYLEKLSKYVFGKSFDFDNPTTYNEKLNWLKLFNRNPILTRMVDKFESKKIINEILGPQYVIKNYGVWEKFEDIDFNLLPDKFVLKTTHDSGGVYVCDKNTMNKEMIKNDFEQRLKKNYYENYREWAYKDVKPRIIAEEFLEDNNDTKGINDWKLFYSYGELFMYYINRGSHTDDCESMYFDVNNNPLPFKHFQDKIYSDKIIFPDKFDEMKRLGSIISKDLPFIRVDFYYINNRIYVGEFTMYPDAGFVKFKPNKYDSILGKYIKLKK